LPVFVWFTVELAFDVCPIGIIDLEVLAPATGTITKNAIHLEANGTFSALKLSIDFTFNILRSDGTPVRRTTGLVCDVFRAPKGIFHHFLKLVDDVHASFFNGGFLGVFQLL
jgi:hypothetical protein